jgi:hypothetical protein
MPHELTLFLNSMNDLAIVDVGEVTKQWLWTCEGMRICETIPNVPSQILPTLR